MSNLFTAVRKMRSEVSRGSKVLGKGERSWESRVHYGEEQRGGACLLARLNRRGLGFPGGLRQHPDEMQVARRREVDCPRRGHGAPLVGMLRRVVPSAPGADWRERRHRHVARVIP